MFWSSCFSRSSFFSFIFSSSSCTFFLSTSFIKRSISFINSLISSLITSSNRRSSSFCFSIRCSLWSRNFSSRRWFSFICWRICCSWLRTSSCFFLSSSICFLSCHVSSFLSTSLRIISLISSCNLRSSETDISACLLISEVDERKMWSISSSVGTCISNDCDWVDFAPFTPSLSHTSK